MLSFHSYYTIWVTVPNVDTQRHVRLSILSPAFLFKLIVTQVRAILGGAGTNTVPSELFEVTVHTKLLHNIVSKLHKICMFMKKSGAELNDTNVLQKHTIKFKLFTLFSIADCLCQCAAFDLFVLCNWHPLGLRFVSCCVRPLQDSASIL